MQEQGWLGVNMRLEPHLLPPGYVSFARNTRFSKGVPEPRGGAQFPAWANNTGSTGTSPWGEVHGVGVFSDPVTRFVYQVIAADGKIYRCTPNNWPVEMTLPAGETITGTVTFTQAAGKLICHRGFDTDPLWTEGMSFAWTAIPDPNTAAGVVRFPNVERSIYFQGRIWAWTNEDTLAFSDFNDPSAMQPVTQEFYINPGSRSRGVVLAKLGNSSIILFKDREIHVLYNAYGDMSAAYGDTITLEFGCVAPDSVVDVGSELWFMSNDGIRSLVEIQTDSSTGTRSIVRFKTAKNEQGQEFPVEISDPIRPLIDRLVSTSLGLVSGVYANRRFYLAVPLDTDELVGEELLTGLYIDFDVPLVMGAKYRYVRGNEVLTEYAPVVAHLNSETFTAGDDLAYAAGSAYPDRSTGSLRRVYSSCNTAVLVYDFTTGAWAGYDDYNDVGISRLVSLPVSGVDRVLAVDVRGYVAMLDTPSYADQRAVPGVEFVLAAVPSYGQTLQVNGGDTIAAYSDINNGAALWAIGDETPELSLAFNNLFSDEFANGGFYSNAFNVWDAGAIWAQQIIEGGTMTALRLWSTNGILPIVTHNVTGLEVRYLTERPIETELITRGYGDGSLSNGARVSLDVQTWASDLTVSLLTAGVEEEYDVTTYTPDRTKYIRPANQADFVEDNSGNNFMAPYREDYSVQFGPDGTTEINLADGIRLDLHQHRRLIQSIADPVEWTYARVRVLNTSGRCRLTRLALTAQPAGEREGAT